MEASRLYLTASSLTLCIIGTCTLLLLKKVSGIKHYVNEPPWIEPKFPVIGHVIGLLQQKYGYYVNLFKKTGLQIYCLAFPGMPGGRVYVINSPDLVLSVQRNPTKISFWRVEAMFTGKLAGLSSFATKILAENADSDNGQPSYLREGMINVHTTMKPGEDLLITTRAAIKVLASSIEALGHSHTDQVDLGIWVGDRVMASVTNSIFGPQNPYQKPEIAEGFWVFQKNASGLMSLPLPWITCAKSYAAREKVVTAFEKYYAARGCDTASHWVKGATSVSDRYGISDKDKSRVDISNSHAIISNTVPSAIWTIYHIFSDTTIVDEIRAAMIPYLTITNNDGVVTYDIDLSQVRDVPLLRSVLHEALRHYANGTGTRIVVEDIMLDSHYFLKKDTFVFMPNQSYHFNASAWGPTVDDFDARRFMNNKIPSGSFRAFGGGANLCPGRFFAMNTILAMSAMLVLQYDIKPVAETWIHPGVDDSNMTLLVHPPKGKIMVNVTPREGCADRKWAFRLS